MNDTRRKPRPEATTGHDAPSRSGGFAVAVVVLLLFAVGVAGATAYQLVRIEAELSTQAREGSAALAVAVAGMERLVATNLGTPADTTTYAVGDGTAVVTTRLVARRDSATDLYMIRSEGTISDARYPDSPARRIVTQYALLHREPVEPKAVVAVNGGLGLDNGVRVQGADSALVGECARAGTHDAGGVLTSDNAWPVDVNEWQGNPAEINVPGSQAFFDSLKVRWDVLQDPSFEITYWDDGAWPDFSTLDPDTFYVIRATEDLRVDADDSGWGVLVVPGNLWVDDNFSWRGIILAGTTDDLWTRKGGKDRARIQGLLVAGLDGVLPDQGLGGIEFDYHSCWAQQANNALAYLELLPGTWSDYF